MPSCFSGDHIVAEHDIEDPQQEYYQWSIIDFLWSLNTF